MIPWFDTCFFSLFFLQRGKICIFMQVQCWRPVAQDDGGGRRRWRRRKTEEEGARRSIKRIYGIKVFYLQEFEASSILKKMNSISEEKEPMIPRLKKWKGFILLYLDDHNLGIIHILMFNALSQDITLNASHTMVFPTLCCSHFMRTDRQRPCQGLPIQYSLLLSSHRPFYKVPPDVHADADMRTETPDKMLRGRKDVMKVKDGSGSKYAPAKFPVREAPQVLYKNYLHSREL